MTYNPDMLSARLTFLPTENLLARDRQTLWNSSLYDTFQKLRKIFQTLVKIFPILVKYLRIFQILVKTFPWQILGIMQITPLRSFHFPCSRAAWVVVVLLLTCGIAPNCQHSTIVLLQYYGTLSGGCLELHITTTRLYITVLNQAEWC